MWTTTRSKRQLDSCCLNSDLICILSQVEDLAQQVECSDIEVLSNVSEKEVKTQKNWQSLEDAQSGKLLADKVSPN